MYKLGWRAQGEGGGWLTLIALVVVGFGFVLLSLTICR